MSTTFVHLSDIHFGQERDHTIHVHNDVKQQLIKDAAEVVSALPGGAADGILVTGDVAYSGKREEYDDAAAWLDELAGSIGCAITRVQMVPGNHDLDRDKQSVGASFLLDYIRQGGAEEYEKVVSNPDDRATLLARFQEYEGFSAGYDCASDSKLRYATNLEIELAPSRSIRFIRMNSSLLCHGREGVEAPELMLGTRQFPIPRDDGIENIVLVHHPLHWYKDEDQVRRYMRSRARVVITGHEHNPKVVIDNVNAGEDLMMLAAGATVPPESDDSYTFTYNIIEFDWDEKSDALAVTMHPRTWNSTTTRFEADQEPLGNSQPRFALRSPNFRKGKRSGDRARSVEATRSSQGDNKGASKAAGQPVAKGPISENEPSSPHPEGYELALLRFFRDLLESERLQILVKLNAIPADFDERMTQAVERKMFDWLTRKGKLAELNQLIDGLIDKRGAA